MQLKRENRAKNQEDAVLNFYQKIAKEIKSLKIMENNLKF